MNGHKTYSDPHTALGLEAKRRRDRVAEAAASGPPEPPEPPLAAADAVDHLTARRLYASAALTGMLAGTEPGARYLKPAILAPLALGYADALIAAERQNGDPA